MRAPAILNGFVHSAELSDEDIQMAIFLEGKINASSSRHITAYTRWLSDKHQLIAEHVLNRLGVRDYEFWGGFAESERKILGIYIENSYIDDVHSVYPIQAFRALSSEFRKLNHRDYLGSMLALGIKRELIGDIVVLPGNEAVIFVCDHIAGFLKDNFTKAGSNRVDLHELAYGADEIENLLASVKSEFELIRDTVASLRIDAIVAAMLNLSRSNAQTLIKAERVQINHSSVKDSDYVLEQGCKLSIKGFGRYELAEIGDQNKKGRYRIVIKKLL